MNQPYEEAPERKWLEMAMNVDDLLAMSREDFAQLVDMEVRGRAPADQSALLRSPELADRWYSQLVVMKKSAESQLAAKAADDKHQRLALLDAADASEPMVAKDLRRRASESYQLYLKWRAGVLRFRAGVEERLAEASWRRRSVPSMIPTALLDERRQLLDQVAALSQAIGMHKASMADVNPDDIDDADEQLWKVLS